MTWTMPSSRRGSRWVAIVAPLVSTVLLAAPALALPAGPSPRTSARAESVAERTAQVEQATARADALSAQAGLALEAYQAALRALAVAQTEQLLQQQALADSARALRASDEDLGRWARASYQYGGSAGELAALVALVQSTPPADWGRNVLALRGITGDKTSAVDRAASAQRAQAMRAARLQAAGARALAAAREAEAAHRRSGQLLGAQQDALAALTRLLAGAQQAQELQARRRQALRAATAQAAGCANADLSPYANGQIPPEALCPLSGAPGRQLRADAAAAFDALAAVYRAESGASLCVTDSYRPLEAQLRVYAARPGLAAVPGTSNHGWGVAVDLCGGVERFGTVQHQWLVRNGPAFGWFHPQWARQGGPKPEPWHWEFAG